MVIVGMQGMGDNIYQRPFVREITERVYLYTSWPQLYSDMPHVYPVRPKTRLRTQMKNVLAQERTMWHRPPHTPQKKIGYGNRNLRAGSIVRAMKKQFRVEPKFFDLPKYNCPKINKPYAVIRPVTIRSEWRNESRNPDPCYIEIASQVLAENGYHTVSIADLQDQIEWAPSLPKVDTAYHFGEMTFEHLLGLVEHASVIVGGVGWIVPAAISARVPLITILGGQGMCSAPEKITDTPMPMDRVEWIYPDNYCMCSEKLHKCCKTISNFEHKFLNAMEKLCLSAF